MVLTDRTPRTRFWATGPKISPRQTPKFGSLRVCTLGIGLKISVIEVLTGEGYATPYLSVVDVAIKPFSNRASLLKVKIPREEPL